MTQSHENPPSPVPPEQLDPESLGQYYLNASEEMRSQLQDTTGQVIETLDGHKPTTEVVEVTPPGSTQRVMAAAIRARHGSAQEVVRSGIASDRRSMIFDAAQAQLSEDEIDRLDRWGVVSGDSRFGSQLGLIYQDLFVHRGEGKLETDFTDADPAGSILRSIDGVKGVGDLRTQNSEDARPLTEQDADELVQLMPTILAYSEYKMGKWHGQTGAMTNSIKLLERLALLYPDKVAEIDIEPTIAAANSMIAAGVIDMQTGTHYAKEKAQTDKDSHLGNFAALTRIKAQQRMTADTMLIEPPYVKPEDNIVLGQE